MQLIPASSTTPGRPSRVGGFVVMRGTSSRHRSVPNDYGDRPGRVELERQAASPSCRQPRPCAPRQPQLRVYGDEPLAFLNGSLVPESEALTLSIFDHGFAYCDQVYDVTRERARTSRSGFKTT